MSTATGTGTDFGTRWEVLWFERFLKGNTDHPTESFGAAEAECVVNGEVPPPPVHLTSRSARDRTASETSQQSSPAV